MSAQLDRLLRERMQPAPEREPAPSENEAEQPRDPAGVMLGLQSSFGNARTGEIARAVRERRENGEEVTSSLIQRNVVTDIMSFGHDVAEGIGLESSFDANLARARLFLEGGPYGPKDVEGAPGSEGGFEAEYDPLARALWVRMRVSVLHKHGLDDETTPGTVIPGDATLQPLAAQAMNPATPLADRQALIQRYKWAAAEKATWRDDLKNLIESRWSSGGTGHEFHLNKPQWEWIGGRVNIQLDVHERPRGGRNADDHLEVTTTKFPPGENLYTRGSFSSTNPGAAGNATDQTMQLASTDIGPRPDYNVLRRAVFFDIDKDVLRPDMVTFLNDWIRAFSGATTDARSKAPKITLEAHTSATGSDAHNMDLAQRRANRVRDFLTGNGFANVVTRVSDDVRGEAGARGGENADERRVDLVVGDGSPQVLAVHEFGHAFGLGDEYANTPPVYGGTAGPVGTAAAHDTLVQAMQDDAGVHLPGAIQENTEGIMSAGNAIWPQHYATFHHALVDVTGETEWALGPPHPYPTGPGAPTPGTGTAPGTGTGATPAPGAPGTPVPAGPAPAGS